MAEHHKAIHSAAMVSASSCSSASSKEDNRDERENRRKSNQECGEQVEGCEDKEEKASLDTDSSSNGEEGELELSGGTQKSSKLPLGQHKIMKKRRSLGTLVVDSTEFVTTAMNHQGRPSGSSRIRREREAVRRGRSQSKDGQEESGSRSLSRGARKRGSIYVTSMRINDAASNSNDGAGTTYTERPRPRPPSRLVAKRRSSMETRPVSKLDDFLPKDDFERNMSPGNTNDHQIAMPIRQVSRCKLSDLSAANEVAEMEHMESIPETDASEGMASSTSSAVSSPTENYLSVEAGLPAMSSPPSKKVKKKKSKDINTAGFQKIVPTSSKRKGKKATNKSSPKRRQQSKAQDHCATEDKKSDLVMNQFSEDYELVQIPTTSEEEEDINSIKERRLGYKVEQENIPMVLYDETKLPMVKLNDSEVCGGDKYDDSEPLSVTWRSMTEFSDFAGDDSKSPVANNDGSKKSGVKTTIKSLGRLFGVFKWNRGAKRTTSSEFEE